MWLAACGIRFYSSVARVRQEVSTDGAAESIQLARWWIYGEGDREEKRTIFLANVFF